jgi:hypothetical protein
MRITSTARLFLLFMASLAPAVTAFANAQVEACQNNTCVCIYWFNGGSATVEVRCSGEGGAEWSGGSNPPDGGSWGGTGDTPNPGAAPGTILAGTLYQAVTNAQFQAKGLLRGTKQYTEDAKVYYTPNQCTQLFNGSPFSENGYSIMGEYVKFRNGEGYRDPRDPATIPCDSGIPAWTECCTHNPYVLICAGFERMGKNDQIARLIHEVMHVAGQRESQNGNTGSSYTDPNASQITQAVKDACGL